MKTTLPALCAMLISAVSLCTALSAQNVSDSPGGTSDRRSKARADSTLSRGDRGFFEKAAMSGMKEVAVSEAVVARLTNPEVKRFAEMMIADHSGANTELTVLAGRKGVSLPAKETKFAEKWSKKSDKADNIDKEYMKEMVSDHEEQRGVRTPRFRHSLRKRCPRFKRTCGKRRR
jgi:putative membrane protein